MMSETEANSNFEQLNSKLDLLIDKVSATNNKIEKLEISQKELEKSISYLHEDFAESKDKIKTLEDKVEKLSSTVDSYKNLAKRIDGYEYAERARCVELNGIPFKNEENLMEGLSKILHLVNVPSINIASDIDKIYRIRKSNRIVIKFLQSTKRDDFFYTYRKNIIDISKLGFKENTKVYINEVLSTSQSKLFWLTRSFKTEHNYKYVWTFRQKIYLRKTEDSDAILINNEEDLTTLASV